MPNLLNGTNSTSSISTVHVTTTVHGSITLPTLVFGLPPEVFVVIILAVVGIVFLFFRFQVKGVPVYLVWIYKNGTAVWLKAREDLQGIFLDVIKGGKKVEVLKKTGLALPVRYLPNNFKAYIETPAKNVQLVGAMAELKMKGFTVEERSDRVQGRIRRHLIKTYLIEKKAETTEALAYLDVSLGGLKQARIYASIEGSGETIDWKPKIEGEEGKDPGNTVLIQEMRSAAKGFFALLAEMLQGGIRSLLLPLIAGLGIGGLLVAIIFIALGFHR